MALPALFVAGAYLFILSSQGAAAADTTPPVMALGAPKPGSHLRGTVPIEINATDTAEAGGDSSGLAELRVWAGGILQARGAGASASLAIDTTKLKAGRRLFKFIAVDKAGNVARLTRRYVIDNAKPEIPAAYFTPSLPAAATPAVLSLTVRDEIAVRMDVTVRIRNAAGKLLQEAALGKVARDRPRSVELKMPRAEGRYRLYVIAVDKAGNRRVRRSYFAVGNYWLLDNVRSHVFELSKNIGVRVEGTDGEHRAADYIESRLRGYGYRVERQSFALPDGKTSYNVVARKRGSEPAGQFVIGAHYDSKSPSPGANDNGTGTGVVLEMARLLKTKKLRPTMVFVLFGAEERFGAGRYPEHQGSQHFVGLMSGDERRRTLGMISVDMVGVGSTFHVRSMRKGTMSLVDDILAFARGDGTAISYAQDYGWSDHDQFELAGMPAAWLEWRNDPLFHTTGDAYERVQWDAVDITGGFLSRYLLNRWSIQ